MYSSLNDIKKLLPDSLIIQLTDDEDINAINQERVDAAIYQADAEIDADCGNRYSVPFTTVPPIIQKHSVDIAIYNLYSRRVEEIPKTRADRYKNAKESLEGIASGKISLGVTLFSPDDFSTGVLVTSHFDS